MSVKIEFNAETSAKVHEEMLEFTRLFLGAQPSPAPLESRQAYTKPVEPAQKAETATDTKEVVQEEQKTEAVVEKQKTPRSRSSKAKNETTKEETKPEDKEEVSGQSEDTSASEDFKDEAGEEIQSSYGEGFEDCKTDEEVMTKVRLFLNTFNNVPGNPPKAKAIFAEYGVPTVPKMTIEQAIDFYNKLKAV